MPMDDRIVTFKEMMHEPMLIEGGGKYSKLSEILGEDNADRLRELGVIKLVDEDFELTKLGKKFVEVFNNRE
jgi:hypothetical protein